MNKMLLAGAIAVATAITGPVFAQPAETTQTPQPQQIQPAPATAPQRAGAEQDGDEKGGAEHWMHERGEWGMRGGPMMRHMMMRGMMMRGDPQQRCIDQLAWRAARRAYIEAKLDLTQQQRPLWDKVQGIAQTAQQKERQLCGTIKGWEQSTVLDRIDRAQQFLSARLDALQAARPAVQALYQALSPEQREVMDHPFRDD